MPVGVGDGEALRAPVIVGQGGEADRLVVRLWTKAPRVVVDVARLSG